MTRVITISVECHENGKLKGVSRELTLQVSEEALQNAHDDSGFGNVVLTATCARSADFIKRMLELPFGAKEG